MNVFTEQELILAWQPWLQRLASIAGRGLDPQDSYAIASMKLLEAARCYRSTLSAFWPFARQVIRDALAETRRENNFIRSREWIRLDANIDEQTPALRLQNCLGFLDFMNSLPYDARATAWMLVEKYTQEEIMESRGISAATFERHLSDIRKKWLAYEAASLDFL